MASVPPSSFLQDTAHLDTNLYVVAIIDHDGLDIGVSTNQVTIGTRQHRPILLDVSTIREKLNVVKRTHSISSCTLKLSNAEYDGVRFSDLVASKSLVNSKVSIYWCSPKTTDYDSSYNVFSGTVHKYTSDKKTATIEIEDSFRKFLNVEFPIKTIGDGDNVPENDRGKVYPIPIGKVRNAPTVSKHDSSGKLRIYGTVPYPYIYPNTVVGRVWVANNNYGETFDVFTLNPFTVFKDGHFQRVMCNLKHSAGMIDSNGIGEHYGYSTDGSTLQYHIYNDDGYVLIASKIYTQQGYSERSRQSTGNPLQDNKAVLISIEDFHSRELLTRDNNVLLHDRNIWANMNPGGQGTHLDGDVAIVYEATQFNDIVTLSSNADWFSNNSDPDPDYFTGLGAGGTYAVWYRYAERFTWSDLSNMCYGRYKGSYADGYTYTGDPYVDFHFEGDMKKIGHSGGATIDGSNFQAKIGMMDAYDYYDRDGDWSHIRPHEPPAFDVWKNIDPWDINNGETRPFNSNNSASNYPRISFEKYERKGNESKDNYEIDLRENALNNVTIGAMAQISYVDQGINPMQIQAQFDFKKVERQVAYLADSFDTYPRFMDMVGMRDGVNIIDQRAVKNYQAVNFITSYFLGYDSDVDGVRLINEPNDVYKSAYEDWNYDFSIHKPIKASQFFKEMSLASPYVYGFDNDGQFTNYTIPEDGGVRDYTIEQRHVIDFTYKRSDPKDLITSCQVQFGFNYATNKYEKETKVFDIEDYISIYDPAYYGFKGLVGAINHTNTRKLIDDNRGKYIQYETTAEKLALWTLLENCNSHLEMKVKVTLAQGLKLRVGSIIDFDSLLGGIRPFGFSYVASSGTGNVADPINGQGTYTYFIITETKKTLNHVEFSCRQLHNLSEQNLLVYGCTQEFADNGNPNCNYDPANNTELASDPCWTYSTVNDGDCDCSHPPYHHDGGCGCSYAGTGPSGCDNVCGSTAVTDCFGVCGGPAIKDDCDFCGGDCFGISDGYQYPCKDEQGDYEFDCQGNCAVGRDCAGICGGSATEQYSTTNYNDGNPQYCGCSNESLLNPNGNGCCNPDQVDCNNVCGGSAYINSCGICVEGNTGLLWNEGDLGCGCGQPAPNECNWCPGGSAFEVVKDNCGICGGDCVGEMIGAGTPCCSDPTKINYDSACCECPTSTSNCIDYIEDTSYCPTYWVLDGVESSNWICNILGRCEDYSFEYGRPVSWTNIGWWSLGESDIDTILTEMQYYCSIAPELCTAENKNNPDIGHSGYPMLLNPVNCGLPEGVDEWKATDVILYWMQEDTDYIFTETTLTNTSQVSNTTMTDQYLGYVGRLRLRIYIDHPIVGDVPDTTLTVNLTLKMNVPSWNDVLTICTFPIDQQVPLYSTAEYVDITLDYPDWGGQESIANLVSGNQSTETFYVDYSVSLNHMDDQILAQKANYAIKFRNTDRSDSSECPKLGDFNGDGRVDILDLVQYANCIVEDNCMEKLLEDSNGCDVLDVNGDGDHNILDLINLSNCILDGTCEE